LTDQELAWIATAGADIRAIFEAPTTTVRERKQLVRAVIAEVGLTVHSPRRIADLRIVWQGGAVTEVAMPMNKPGGRVRVTNEDTIALVRRLAQHYDDRTIAAILSKQKRRTATGLPFTRARVAILRADHAIPVYQPPTEPDGATLDEDVVVVTITEAEKILGISRETLYRWIRDGFITAEQITPGAPWRIRIDQALRDRIQPKAPEGWLGLNDAAKALGAARQTVLHRVQRGELQAVHVNRGRRKGLRINVKLDQPGLFDTTDRRNAQC
jgi:excisionase family DNA binding protein